MSDPNKIEMGLDTDLGSIEAVRARKAELLAELGSRAFTFTELGPYMDELGRLNEEELFYVSKRCEECKKLFVPSEHDEPICPVCAVK